MVRITASEALYGFAGWLTARKKPITIGAKYSAGAVAVLVDEWCKTNKLPHPRVKVFAKNIKQPKG
jgi:hypothetical protein